MGQRANLFEEARNTINVLKSKAASRHTYEMNFPMSIMRVTRRHLHNVSIELIDAFERNDYILIPALMKRYYKVNQLRGKGTAGETRNTEAFRVRLFPPQKLHFCIQGASSAERATKSGSVASL